MGKTTTERSELLNNLVELMIGARPCGERKDGVQTPSVAEAANQIRVRSVCYNVNPDATTTLVWSQYRFDPWPTKCTQCGGPVITDPMMVVRPWCYVEKVD